MTSIVEFTRGSNVHADVVWPAEVTPDGGLAGCTVDITDATAAIAPYLSVSITDAINRAIVVDMIVPGSPADASWTALWAAFPQRSYFRITVTDTDGNPMATTRVEMNVI